jgi:hypothetical protein
MGRVGDYRRWWPWLRRFDAAALTTGDVWAATVQPPLPYRLSFELHLLEVEPPHLVAVDVTGDIEGEARLEVSAVPAGSELHFRSQLAPTSTVLRAIATVAGPVARYGHEWVLDTGLEQFRARALAES